MLPALIASIGLPILTRVVGAALGRIDNPVAKAASDALTSAGAAMDKSDISPDQLREANRHIEQMAVLESNETRAALTQINETFRAEVRSDDPYVRRWRPTFGYAVALTWVLQVGALVYAIVRHPEQAGAIIAAMASLSFIWGIALSVLGVNAVKRSQDKLLAAGQPPEPSLIGALVKRVIGTK
jgi:hypothetical protein